MPFYGPVQLSSRDSQSPGILRLCQETRQSFLWSWVAGATYHASSDTAKHKTREESVRMDKERATGCGSTCSIPFVGVVLLSPLHYTCCHLSLHQSKWTALVSSVFPYSFEQGIIIAVIVLFFKCIVITVSSLSSPFPPSPSLFCFPVRTVKHFGQLGCLKCYINKVVLSWDFFRIQSNADCSVINPPANRQTSFGEKEAEGGQEQRK